MLGQVWAGADLLPGQYQPSETPSQVFVSEVSLPLISWETRWEMRPDGKGNVDLFGVEGDLRSDVAPLNGLVARALGYVDTATITTTPATIAKGEPGGPGVRVKRRNMWGYTGVEVKGRTIDGEELSAVRADTRAESDPTYIFYRGYRRLEQFSDPALISQADVDAIADLMYASMRLRVGDEVTATIIGANLTLNRRQAWYLTGVPSTIVNASVRHATMSIIHHWGPRLPDCTTEVVAVPFP